MLFRICASAAIFSMILTFGCTSQPVAGNPECDNLDWFEQGRRAGIAGHSNPLELMAQEKCQPNDDQQLAYKTGYNKGVSQYCRPSSAIALGKSGAKINAICPVHLKPEFIANYNLGLEIFKLRREQELLQGQIDNLFRLLTVQSLSQLERESLSEQLTTLENQQAQLSQRLDRLQETQTN